MTSPSLRIRILLASTLVLLVATTAVGLWQRSSPSAAGAAPPGADQQVAMAPGEEMVLADGTRLRFVAVIEDSRCPMDAMCPTMGEAVVQFEVETAAGQHERVDVSFEGEPVRASVHGYVIEVTEVQPYPMASQPAAPGDYRVGASFSEQ